MLRSGRYSSREFRIGKNATLSLDLSSGPVVIDVVSDIVFGRGAETTLGPRKEASADEGSPADVLFRSGGNVTLHSQGSHLGTFLAPSGVIVTNDSTLVGALYANTVRSGSRAHITGLPALDLFLDFFFGP